MGAGSQSLSEILLVDLPANGEVISLSRFVEMQEHHVLRSASLLNARSLEIENAVRDLIEAINKQPFDQGVAVFLHYMQIRIITYYWCC